MVERRLGMTRTSRTRGGLLAAVMSATLGVSAFISPAQATVAALGVFAEDPPEPEAVVVELSVDRVEVDVNNPTSTFTATPSGPIPEGASVTSSSNRVPESVASYPGQAGSAGTSAQDSSAPGGRWIDGIDHLTLPTYVSGGAPTGNYADVSVTVEDEGYRSTGVVTATLHTTTSEWMVFTLMIDGRSTTTGARCGFSSSGFHSQSRGLVFSAAFSEECKFDHVELVSTTSPKTFITYLPQGHPVLSAGPWSVELTSTTPSAGLVFVNATVNQNIASTGPIYAVFIHDLTTGERIIACTSQSVCRTQVRLRQGKHVYVATIASIHDSKQDVQATSDLIDLSLPGTDEGPTDPRETAGGSNPSEPCSARCHGDPVNTATGEFHESSVDLAVPGVGPALDWRRTFATSLAGEPGSMGHGWSSGYDMRLVPRGGSDLMSATHIDVVQENGSVVSFAADGEGEYVAAPRVLARLERDESGVFRFVRHEQTVFVFNGDGRLTRIEDSNAEGLSLEYGPDGLLERVVDDVGRSLVPTWSDGLVTRVVDSTGRTTSYDYSAAGDLVRVALPDGSSKWFEYDEDHRVVGLVSADGGTTRNEYDSLSRVVAQTDPLGRTMTFDYQPDATTVTAPDGAVTVEHYVDGQLRSETRAAGTPFEAKSQYVYGPTNQVIAMKDELDRITLFTYDTQGNRTGATDPSGRVSTTTYDQLNNPLTVTNPAGETATFTYDDRGNPLTTTAPDGATATFTVNPDGTVATSTDATGRTTSYAYDAHGFLAAATGPDGATVVTSYDSLGRLISSTDPRGTVPGADPADYTSTSTYDAVGRLLATTDPVGAVVTLAYDAAGRPETVTDALGATTTKEYDVAGQLVAVEDTLGNRTTMTYDDAGRILTVTDALGATTTNEYDVLGRLTAVTDALGRTSHTEYDAGNRVTATITPSGARTAYTYDVADQLLTVTDPLGGVTTTTYDDAGRPVTVTDADGRAVTTTYDEAGRAAVVTRADASTLSWAYDGAGRVLAYTDAAGIATTYTYDATGRRASATGTAGRTTSYAYGPSGLLDTVTLPDGQHVDYAYDAAGRRTGIDYSDATPDVTYAYDDAGRATTMTDGTGATAYSYDALGRPLEVDGPDATVGYAWDAVGQLTALTYPTGEVVERAYDDVGQLTSVTDWADREFGFDWTVDGQLSAVTYPNGVETAYDYDAAGQVVGITAASAAGLDMLALAYGYSDAGLLVDQGAIRSAEGRAPPVVPSTSASQYTWDPLGRVSEATGDGAGAFAFDAAGSVTALADGRSLTYDAARQLTSMAVPAAGEEPATSTAFGYDARGNRATATTDVGSSAGTVSHTFDLADRLTSVTGADGALTSYAYDGGGLRASATTGVGAGAVTEEFAWDVAASVPLLLTDGEHAFVYGVGGTPLAQVALDDGAVEYLHTDLTGSVRATTDDAGQVTSEADYDVYGLAVAVAGQVRCGEVTRFGYAGEYADPTGYVYLRVRYYDPATAQFLTRDPLVDLTGNPYGYTDGNPLQYVDPLGLWPDIDWGQVGMWAAVGAVAALAIACVATVICGVGVGAVAGAATATFAVTASAATVASVAVAGAAAGGTLAVLSQEHQANVWFNESSGSTGSGEEATCGENLSDNPGQIADKTGRSVQEIRDAIHAVKRDIIRSGTRRNPDVLVDTNTGEVYIKMPNGSASEDSFGNIFDHLGG